MLVEARWDDDAGVWIATSSDMPGLVVEAESWPLMIAEVRCVLPELLEIAGRQSEDVSLTFKAEEHLSLAGV